MSDTDEREQIHNEMARLRDALHDDVQEVARGTRRMADWRFYVRRYPWACVGAAFAVGFLLVPKRSEPEALSPDVDTLLQLAKDRRLVIRPRGDRHVSGGMLTRLAETAVRVVVSQAARQAGRHLIERCAASQEDHPAPNRPR